MWRTEPFSRSHEAAPYATTTTRTTATSDIRARYISSRRRSSRLRSYERIIRVWLIKFLTVAKSHPSTERANAHRVWFLRHLPRRESAVCAPKRIVSYDTTPRILIGHAAWVVNRDVVAESIINSEERVWQWNEVPSRQEIKRLSMKTSHNKSSTRRRVKKRRMWPTNYGFIAGRVSTSVAFRSVN